MSAVVVAAADTGLAAGRLIDLILYTLNSGDMMAD